MKQDPYSSGDSAEDVDESVLALLRSLPSEQGSPSSKTDAAIMAMAAEKMSAIRRRKIIKHTFIWITTVAACITLSVYIGNLIAPPVDLPTYAVSKHNSSSPREDTAAIILQQVAAVFPGQLQSIQRDDSGLQITLSETPDVVSTEGILIVIKSANEVKEIITFSGQTVEILGHMVTVDTTDDGQIKIHGTDFEWTTSRPTKPLPNIEIQASHI